MNSSAVLARFGRSWPLLVLLLIAAVWLHRTPYSASGLEIPPDTVEYALAPLQLLETGRFEIIVQGRGFPPRYPPWFSALIIAPAYLLFGHEPGNAILPITLLAVTGVGFAYAIGKRISSALGGVFAGLALLFLPTYSRWAIQVMTDVPCTTLMLGACLVYLRLRTKPGSALGYFGAGALVAITALFRPVYAAMLLPFLLDVVRLRKDVLLRGTLFLLPMGAAVAATFVYNASTFGSPFRNGYNFWVPAPMDYPAMVFSLSNIPSNLEKLGLGFPILVLVCIAAVLLARTFRPLKFAAARDSFRAVLLFLGLTTSPILLFHLVYFYPDTRFFLPILAAAALLAGVMLALVVDPGRETVLKVLLPAVLLIALSARIATPGRVPWRRLVAERVRNNTPENAVVISAIDPVYLAQRAGRGSARRMVPISRNIEFAWAVLAWKRIDNPRVRLLKPHDIPAAVELLRPQGDMAVVFVASERLDELATEIARGTPVFLEVDFIDAEDQPVVDAIKARFRLIERAPFLYQLQLP